MRYLFFSRINLFFSCSSASGGYLFAFFSLCVSVALYDSASFSSIYMHIKIYTYFIECPNFLFSARSVISSLWVLTRCGFPFGHLFGAHIYTTTRPPPHTSHTPFEQTQNVINQFFVIHYVHNYENDGWHRFFTNSTSHTHIFSQPNICCFHSFMPIFILLHSIYLRVPIIKYLLSISDIFRMLWFNYHKIRCESKRIWQTVENSELFDVAVSLLLLRYVSWMSICPSLY